MHGSPFRQFLLTLAAVIVLGVLLFLSTRPALRSEKHSSSPTPANSSSETPISAFMSVKYAHKPEKLHISLADGKETTNIYQGTPDEMTIEESFDIPRKASATIIVEASWPEGTPNTPISITIEPDGLPTRSSTNWSINRELHNTYLFSW